MNFETQLVIAPYKVLQGATAHTAATQPGTPGRTHSLFDKCVGGFRSHPKDEAMIKRLA